MSQTPNLLTVQQFAEKHPAFKVGGLRWEIFNADKIGLKQSGAILRRGRKVLIDEARYFSWLYGENQSKGNIAA